MIFSLASPSLRGYCFLLIQYKAPYLQARLNYHNVSTNVSQHRWANHCLATLLLRVATLKIDEVPVAWRNIVARTWPNDYNTIQHPQMLYEKFDHFQTWSNNTQHVATRRRSYATCQCNKAQSDIVGRNKGAFGHAIARYLFWCISSILQF